MKDEQILDLYWARSEHAIAETEKKYGRYCYSIANQILCDEEDVKEIMNDAYLKLWNTIPPQRPSILKSYVGMISRQLALNYYEKQHAQKRGGQELFAIFGVKFEDAKIVRKYDGDGEHGVSWLTIFFFDEDAHPLNQMSEAPVSDYIRVSFDNFANFENDILSETILQDVHILYRQNRRDVRETYVESKNLKMISLSEAEEMLAKGYVFGGHACPYCMEEQEAVDFEHYDKVGMEYVMGQDDTGEELERVPFYVFYKYIKEARNGNQIYAKTYVPAIAVSGCEEYFESQKQYHTLDKIWEEEK